MILDFHYPKDDNIRMDNTEPSTKYDELKKYLKNILKTAKKLGLQVQPGGGYAMGYDINNLPPYQVGLFGALSIIEGQGARCKFGPTFGLSFDDTETLEAGFNGNMNTKKRKKNYKPNKELLMIGMELSRLVYRHQLPQQKKRPWEDDNILAPSYDSGIQVSFDDGPAKVLKEDKGWKPSYMSNDSKAKKAKLLADLANSLTPKEAQAAPSAHGIQPAAAPIDHADILVKAALSNKEILDKLVALADQLSNQNSLHTGQNIADLLLPQTTPAVIGTNVVADFNSGFFQEHVPASFSAVDFAPSGPNAEAIPVEVIPADAPENFLDGWASIAETVG